MQGIRGWNKFHASWSQPASAVIASLNHLPSFIPASGIYGGIIDPLNTPGTLISGRGNDQNGKKMALYFTNPAFLVGA